MIEILIHNGNTIYQPSIEGDPKLETYRKISPAKLTFTVVKDSILNFQEGNGVVFRVDGKQIFYGFVFKKSRSMDQLIDVVAYDQLRYLKNKDTYSYTNKSTGELIQMIADDFSLSVGTLEDTGYKVPSRIELNKSLTEMIQNSLDLTLQNTGNMFVLYDKFGKLTLSNVASLKLTTMINDEVAEDFKYSSSIDGETYNKIKLTYDDETTGMSEVFIAKDPDNIDTWGVLQYFDSIDEKVNGDAKANALLELYNAKKRSLTITNAFGDVNVRGGSLLPVVLELGDVSLMNYMVVDKVVHSFGDPHTMDLTLIGGVFNA